MMGDRYAEVVAQVRSLVDGVDNTVGALANVAALLKSAFDHYFWVGFYTVRYDTLQLGPFQGPVACYRIKKGCGVCGTAWAERRTLRVPDVDLFPGHIACSSLSRSEIVVPIVQDGDVVAVIDVDSDRPDAFHSADQEGLEAVAKLLAEALPFG